jgi:hypothetical protein
VLDPRRLLNQEGVRFAHTRRRGRAAVGRCIASARQGLVDRRRVRTRQDGDGSDNGL